MSSQTDHQIQGTDNKEVKKSSFMPKPLKLLINHTIAMFTIPLILFFASQKFFEDYYEMSRNDATTYSMILVVISVLLIEISIVIYALKENDQDVSNQYTIHKKKKLSNAKCASKSKIDCIYNDKYICFKKMFVC